jgi:CDP-diacylglycerol pyrophosphatase
MPIRLAVLIAASLIAIAASVGCTRLAAADPNALWKIVDLDCVPAARKSGAAGQCKSVDLEQRYAILKDITGRAQHLLIPTDRISGIESPRVLAPDAPNYWADAWTARHFVEASLKEPLADNQIGIEINSAYRRSQQQLHIHIDCMRIDMSVELARHRHDAPGQWSWDAIGGSRYRIMRIAGPSLHVDPFGIVARDRPGAAAMAMQTILVTGASPAANDDGWLIVNSGTDIDGGTGSAEGLLDHKCGVARKG